MMDPPIGVPEKAKLMEINQYLTCYLCKGYLIDATTISECLHSFCRSCIIKFLEENSHCPVCELIINKAKPNLKLDKTLQDIVYKLVPDLFLKEMTRRKLFYQPYPQLALRVRPEERGEDTERTIFNAQEKISLSLEYICDGSSPDAIKLPYLIKSEKSDIPNDMEDTQMKRYLLCPGMCRIDVLKKFVRNKYNVDTSEFYIDVLYKRVPLPDHYTLIDVAYIYSWQRNETMKFFFRIIDINKAPKRFDMISASQMIPPLIPKSLARTKSSIGEKHSPSKGTGSVSERKSLSRRKSASVERESEIVRLRSEEYTENHIENKKPIDESNEKCDQIKNIVAKSSADLEVTTKLTEIKEASIIYETDSEKVNKNICDTKNIENSVSEKSLVPVEESNNDKENNCANIESSNTNCDNKEQNVIGDKDSNKQEVVPVVSTINIKNERLSDQFETNGVDNNHVNISLDTSTYESKVPIVDIKTPKIKSEPLSPVKDKSRSPKSPRTPRKSKTNSPKCKKDSPKLKLKIIVQEPQTLSDDPYNFDTNEFFEQQSNLDSSNFICKPNCYTKITLNRTNNVEIITKVQTMPLNGKTGEVITKTEQTVNSYVDKNNSNSYEENNKEIKPLVKKTNKVKRTSKTSSFRKGIIKANKAPKIPKLILSKLKKDKKFKSQFIEDKKSEKIEILDEKTIFFKYLNLQAKPVLNTSSQFIVPKNNDTPVATAKPLGGHKRKNNSPIKNLKAKTPKTHENVIDTPKISPLKEGRPVKIILQQKPKTNEVHNQNAGLQSFISNCKIPSSLSITIKESSEPNSTTPVAPPVKNFIEILKITDDGIKQPETHSIDKAKDLPKLLDDSEKQVDQDLNEIAKSLTEKIPMSTTISHIIGPKQSFSIPIKSTMPTMTVQPAAVPDTSKVSNDTSKKDNGVKTNLSISFQKAFEESIQSKGIKTNKRHSLKNNVQSPKKSKPEGKIDNFQIKKEVPLPKVPIPRLPHQRNLKISNQTLVPRTIANLHSTSLGMNYTVSVGQTSPTKTNKVNGTLSPEKLEIKSEFKSPNAGDNFKGSLKNSPKSSPVVKHMFSTQKLANISPRPPRMSGGTCSISSKNLNIAPDITIPPNTAITLNANELIEKYNFQNLAQLTQLTATFNLNPAVLALTQTNQLAALQQAMLLKQIEMQNRQNWLVRNQGPLLQYENYLKSLSGAHEN